MEISDRKFKVVVIGGSAGSFSVVSKILSQLNPGFPLPMVLCLHRLKHVRSGLVEGLNMKSKIPVIEPYDKEKLKPGVAVLAPSNYHLFVEFDSTISLSTEDVNNHSRPSIDYAYSSAAYAFREKTLGVILTGANKDGAKGMKSIFDKKGYTIVQDPATSDVDTMPQAALKLFTPDEILSPERIVKVLNSLV
jgi:two-component system chemotaxis response regulator CheB